MLRTLYKMVGLSGDCGHILHLSLHYNIKTFYLVFISETPRKVSDHENPMSEVFRKHLETTPQREKSLGSGDLPEGILDMAPIYAFRL